MSASRLAKQPENSAAIEQIHDISRRPQFSGLSGELGVASSQLPIQAKLTIGQPNDRYEQEADRVASQVVKKITAPATDQSSQGMSEKRTKGPEEAEKQTNQEKTSNYRQWDEMEDGEASQDMERAIKTARGSGEKMETGLLQSMGQAIGADFSGVRVHTDATSDRLNKSIQAKAFTTGKDVFFRQGQYTPWSGAGLELIAHELTHVKQQDGGSKTSRQLQRSAWNGRVPNMSPEPTVSAAERENRELQASVARRDAQRTARVETCLTRIVNLVQNENGTVDGREGQRENYPSNPANRPTIRRDDLAEAVRMWGLRGGPSGNYHVMTSHARDSQPYANFMMNMIRPGTVRATMANVHVNIEEPPQG